jgi:HAD-hyrolase-like
MAFCRLEGETTSWEGEAGPSAEWRSIRKPSVPLLEYAVQVLSVPVQEALVVGDQYLTDIAAANLVGVRSAKGPTLEPGSFGLPVRLLQLVRAGLYVAAGLKWPRKRPPRGSPGPGPRTTPGPA